MKKDHRRIGLEKRLSRFDLSQTRRQNLYRESVEYFVTENVTGVVLVVGLTEQILQKLKIIKF